MKQSIFLSILAVLMTSCGQTHLIPEEIYAFIPYDGNEVLIFESNLGAADTIFLSGKDRHIGPTDPLDIFPTKTEYCYILNRHSDPSPPGGTHRYLDGTLVEISMSERNEPWIEIDFAAKDAWFYGDSWLPLKEFDKMPEIRLTIDGKIFDDVVVFIDEKKEYYERSNHIERLYWSKSQGIVRYDKKGNVIWELKEKSAPQQHLQQ